MRRGGGGKENWLLIKMKDSFATAAEAASAPARRPVRKKTTQAAARDGSPNSPALMKGEQPRAGRAGADRATRKTQGGAPTVEVTHADKVWFPESGVTKGDVFDFYRRIGDRLLPYLRDRPATLERLPEGLGSESPHFWQKNTPDYYPSWIPRIELPSERGKPVRYVLVNDVATLLYLVNQGTITLHTWFSRVADLDRPDFVLFDLDPGPAAFTDGRTASSVISQLAKVLPAIASLRFWRTLAATFG